MENNQIDINRYETKYIVDKDNLMETKEEIEKNLKPYYPDPNTIYVLNTSIYFDSPQLTFLKQHLNKINDRCKVRIRCYAPNGIDEDIYYIEVKSKNGDKSNKVRLQLDNNGYEYTLKNGKIDINAALIDTNMEMAKDDVIKQAKYINYIMITNKVMPVCKVTYKRNAYQKDESLRVTLDQNLKVTPLTLIKPSQIEDLKNNDIWDNLKKYGEKFYNQDNFILEVKSKKNVPPWLKNLIKRVGAEEEGFSKYVWAVFQIMSNTLKLMK